MTSIFEEELRQQPEVVERFLRLQTENIQSIVDQLPKKAARHVVIAARGSSDNAARYGQYLFGVHNNSVVTLAAPSIGTVYDAELWFEDALVVAVSQSGSSPDIINVVEKGRRRGCPTIAITNSADSPLARAAEHVILLHAGEEHAVAATKTYTASMAAIALVSACLEGDAQRDSRLMALSQLPDLMSSVIHEFIDRSELMATLNTERLLVVGRGFNLSTAHETALKISELSGILAMPYSAADVLHGPIAAAGPECPVFCIAPAEPSAESLAAVLAAAERHGAETVVISGSKRLLQQASIALRIRPQPRPWLTPLVAVLPGQVVALRLAQDRGRELDHPLGLSKVTQTL